MVKPRLESQAGVKQQLAKQTLMSQRLVNVERLMEQCVVVIQVRYPGVTCPRCLRAIRSIYCLETSIKERLILRFLAQS